MSQHKTDCVPILIALYIVAVVSEIEYVQNRLLHDRML